MNTKNFQRKEKNNPLILMCFIYIFSPLGFYTLFSQINKMLPSFLIYLFFVWFVYYCYKFLIPYLKNNQLFFGLINLFFKKIFQYIWSQKIIFFLLLLIPNMSFYIYVVIIVLLIFI